MTPRVRRYAALAALAVLISAPRAWPQGIIVDFRPGHPIARSYEVREVAVDARVRDQVAEVQVSQTFHNPGSVVLESEYLFPLPEEGAIQNFVLMVDGRELPGRLLPRDEARRVFEQIVRTQRDPALLEYMGRGLFRTSVFPIPPGADRKVTLRYTQLCRRDRDVVEFAYPFGTQKFTTKPIERLTLDLQIDSRQAIKSIYSPTTDTTIRRDGDHEARVRFEQRHVIPTADFRLVYTLADGKLGATVLSYRPSASDDGYFLVLASPEVTRAETRPEPKTVIFALDRSGSMSGKKIDQARKALRFVLDNLRDDDLFNIITYDDRVETFAPELQRYGSESRRRAERFVANIREGGATNIDSALRTAMEMIRDDSRPSYVIFLTDGLPTAGETGEIAIADHCKKANVEHARLFVFGVGYDVNARLLDRLSGGNGGTSEYVKPDEDIETHVGRFYAKMSSPVLSRLQIELAGTDVNRTYPRDVPDLFDGGQLVWVGRYRQSGPTTMVLSGRAGSERVRLEFPAELAAAGHGTTYDFVERIWAIRRVGAIIDQIDLHGRNKELVDELVALSTRYGILTPYTSFLADETVPLHARALNRDRAALSLNQLEELTGESAIAQRNAKKLYVQSRLAAPDSTVTFEAQAPNTPPRATQRARNARSSAAETRANSGARFANDMAQFGGTSAPAAATANAGAAQPGLRVQDARGNETVVTSVRHVGSKTFYYKDDRWIDSTVTPEREREARKLTQFSDEFFRVARGQSTTLNQYLTFAEPVTVDLDGTVYRIER